MEVSRASAIFLGVSAATLVVRYSFGLDPIISSIAQKIFTAMPQLAIFGSAVGNLNMLTNSFAEIGYEVANIFLSETSSITFNRFDRAPWQIVCEDLTRTIFLLGAYLASTVPTLCTLAIQEATGWNCLLALGLLPVCFAILCSSDSRDANEELPVNA